MGYTIVKTDISKIKVDVIVNASNGIGFMGGKIGKIKRLNWVAETLHYVTKGAVEKECKIACKRSKFLPRYLCGYKPGDVFVTNAANLDAEHIIHAVTMRFPGSKASIKVIKKLLPRIILKSIQLNAKSIAIPLLGTGTGRLSKDKIYKLYDKFFSDIDNIEIIVCII